MNEHTHHEEDRAVRLSSYRLRRFRRMRLQRIKQAMCFNAVQLPNSPPDLSRMKLPQSVAVLVCWECMTRTYASRLFLEVVKYQTAHEAGIPFEEMTVEGLRIMHGDDHPIEVIPLVPDL